MMFSFAVSELDTLIWKVGLVSLKLYLLCCSTQVCVRVTTRLLPIVNVLPLPLSPSFSGESVVPELHRSSVLLSAPSHLFLSREILSHDAAGEMPTVFHLKVHHLPSTHKHGFRNVNSAK